MNIPHLLSLLSLGGVVVLVACSSTETDKFASSDSFCTAKAEAECNGLAKKCGATVEACKTKRASTCNTGGATAAGQGRSYRANSAQDCIDSVNSTYKNNANDVTVDNEAETSKVCERVFSGAKAESEQCTNTFECQGALICDKGVCIKEEKVALKGQCNNAGQICEKSTYCQQQGATKFCNPSNKLDEACKVDAPCIDTLRCVSNRCVAKVTGGNPCDNDGECAAEAPYCDAVAKKCRPKYESTSAACKDFGL
jgi:hypothetical protein